MKNADDAEMNPHDSLSSSSSEIGENISEGKLMDELKDDEDHQISEPSSSEQSEYEEKTPSGRNARRPKKQKEKPLEDKNAPISKRDEARKDFEEALARINAGKARRTRQPADSQDVEYDDEAIDLHARMIRACQQDNESILHGKPALKKLELLPEVLRIVNMHHMQEFLLDNRILEAIRMWLEPLPNGTLPSVDLRLSLLESLQALTPLIETQFLRESRVGRIVMFFSVRQNEYPPIQRLSSNLVATWSRPIVGQSADFRSVRRDDFVQSDLLKQRVDLEGSPSKSSTYSKLSQHLHRKRK